MVCEGTPKRKLYFSFKGWVGPVVLLEYFRRLEALLFKLVLELAG